MIFILVSDIMASRKLYFGLQSAYMDLLEVKLKIFEITSSSLQPRLLQKMAYICKQGALVNDQILDTFAEKITKNILKEEDEVKQVLNAWFCKARFQNKFFAPNRDEQMKYTREAIKHYQMVICYCARNPEARKLIPNEYKTSVEVADLLKRQVKLQEKEKKFEEEDQ